MNRCTLWHFYAICGQNLRVISRKILWHRFFYSLLTKIKTRGLRLHLTRLKPPVENDTRGPSNYLHETMWPNWNPSSWGAPLVTASTCKVSTKLPITHSIFHAIFSETTSTRLPKRIKFAKKYNFREINFTKFHRNFFFLKLGLFVQTIYGRKRWSNQS